MNARTQSAALTSHSILDGMATAVLVLDEALRI